MCRWDLSFDVRRKQGGGGRTETAMLTIFDSTLSLPVCIGGTCRTPERERQMPLFADFFIRILVPRSVKGTKRMEENH